MYKHSKREPLVVEQVLRGIKITKYIDGKEDDAFVIPVVDVRRGEDSRRRVNEIIKQQNIQRGSKFFKPSYSVLGRSYN
jgi:hypothetical protein